MSVSSTENENELAPSAPNGVIVVTGDFIVDHHIYEGRRHHFGDQNSRGVCVKEELGGAALTHRLLCEMQRRSKARWQSFLGVDESAALSAAKMCDATKQGCQDQSFAAYAFWRPYPLARESKDSCWRVAEAMGFAGGPVQPGQWPWQPAHNLPPKADVLVIADGGIGFRSRMNARHWRISLQDRRLRELLGLRGKLSFEEPRWIVLKMSAPVAQGDLWMELSEFHSERLVVVVSAAELRQADVRLAPGLSWEETLEQLQNALSHHHDLRSLMRCRDLIVCFGSEGAVWLSNREKGKVCATFVFDPRHVEGEHRNAIEGTVYGSLSCHTATVAAALASSADSPNVELALQEGLIAARQLLTQGHGSTGQNGAGFPAKSLVEAIVAAETRNGLQARTFAFDAASGPIRPGWSLLALQELSIPAIQAVPMYGMARRVLIRGARALRAPTLKVGEFFTADRGEIEALRNLRALAAHHLKNKRDKPLSIGVFGPPGAGKSFAVKELAADLLKKRLGWLEFNLSQFNASTDLIGALHQVRDKILEGKVPVAFFDEFDSQNLRWLKDLLAPMQDGRFQEGQITHPIGQCFFVFAGGTSASYQAFAAKGTISASNDADKAEHFILSKGPDFASRLDGILNVVGPNPRAVTDGSDIFFPVRRALFIRGYLRCGEDERLNILPSVATALLEVSSFRHGSRSLAKILEPFKAARRERADAPLTLSLLPPAEQLALHVDNAEFGALARRDQDAANLLGVDTLAAAVHDFYRQKGKNEKWIKPQHDLEFAQLSIFDQASNRAAARRVAGVLALIGLKLAPGPATAQERNLAEQILRSQADILGEAEHDGWMQWHIDNGWSLAKERADERQQHDLLVPYSELDPENRAKDIDAVLHYIEIAQLAQMKIVPISSRE
jgi:hypothetical protein